jgi:hypothetical protein
LTTNVVLDGGLWLLTEHDQVRLGPLDVIVVGGSRHAWSNRTTSPAILATVGVGIGTEPS